MIHKIVQNSINLENLTLFTIGFPYKLSFFTALPTRQDGVENCLHIFLKGKKTLAGSGKGFCVLKPILLPSASLGFPYFVQLLLIASSD